LITIKDDLARSFYEIESIKNKLYLPTKRELEAEIQKEAARLSLIKNLSFKKKALPKNNILCIKSEDT
jgi:hypothetical protein